MGNMRSLALALHWINRFLDYVETQIWGKATNVDTSTSAFYVFKPYPSSLKLAQHQNWANLQSKIVSPFEGGENYTFLSPKGICIWCAPNSFSGFPETASQQRFPDGVYLVKGVSKHYSQKWVNGVMESCRVVSNKESLEKAIELSTHESNALGWAIKRNVDQWLEKPITWFFVLCFVTATIGIWSAGISISHKLQQADIVDEIAQLDAKVGSKLDAQNKYLQDRNLVAVLSNWRNENGFLPQALMSVASVVIKRDTWNATNIEWQGKTLVLLLDMGNTDITSLVAELEQQGSFDEVSIRPHNNPGTWKLEVIQK